MQHELRNPLHAISVSVDYLENSSLSPPVKELVDSIALSSNAMLRLANDVLGTVPLSQTVTAAVLVRVDMLYYCRSYSCADFTRLQTGRMEIVPVQTDIRAVVRDVVNQFKLLLSPGVQLLSAVMKAVPEYIMVDGPRIRQVLANALTNAIKVKRCAFGCCCLCPLDVTCKLAFRCRRQRKAES